MSASEALPLIRNFRNSHGNRLTVETCHHYLNLTADDVPKNRVDFKCCPPIRDVDNQTALWNGIKAGDINMVVSDHSPSTAEMKLLNSGPDCGNFLKSWGGISSMQFGKDLAICDLIDFIEFNLICLALKQVYRYSGQIARSMAWVLMI